MRKITRDIIAAFRSESSKTIGNSRTDGKTLWLHGNAIARWNKKSELEISNGGCFSNTTRERLNGFSACVVQRKNWVWYLDGKEWDGSWFNAHTNRKVRTTKKKKVVSKESYALLKDIRKIALLGDTFSKNKKDNNKWKLNIIMRGLKSRGLVVPNDWESLSENEKERRLNMVLEELKQ